MTRNLIQHQTRLSFPAFRQQHAAKRSCLVVFLLRHCTTEFVPLGSDSAIGYWLSLVLNPCRRCSHQNSLSDGATPGFPRLPLVAWFPDICPLKQCQLSVSLLQQSQELGTIYNNAWELNRAVRSTLSEIYLYSQYAIALGARSAEAGLDLLAVMITSIMPMGTTSMVASVRVCCILILADLLTWVATSRIHLSGTAMMSAGSMVSYEQAVCEYRFKRRYDFKTILLRRLKQKVRILSVSYRLLNLAESYM